MNALLLPLSALTALAGPTVTIPAGSFAMSGESGRSLVDLPSFEINATEVTVEEYTACVDAGGCSPSRTYSSYCNEGVEGFEGDPINCVYFDNAEGYCDWAGMRLPTEAEWEKAARGGCELYGDCLDEAPTFPWGEDPITCDVAQVRDATGHGCGDESTAPVGSFPDGASPYGVYDMGGNVWEYVTSDGSAEVKKGGSFWHSLAQIDYRYTSRVGGGNLMTMGFRCAADVSSDADGDGVADGVDVCPDAYDPDQTDGDGDGLGDACDSCDGRLQGQVIVLDVDDDATVQRRRVGSYVDLTLADVVDQELAPTLQEMTGQPFDVVAPDALGGDCAAQQTAIFITTTDGDLLESAPAEVQDAAAALGAGLGAGEGYVLFADPAGGVWLVGESPRGAQHALYDYLERLGVRYLTAAPAWTVTPAADDLRLDTAEVTWPSLFHLDYYPSGGFGVHALFDRDEPWSEWLAWQARLRLPDERATTCGHAFQAFNTAYEAEVSADPLTLVESDGVRCTLHDTRPECGGSATRSIGYDTKLNYTHHGTVPCGGDALVSFTDDAGADWCEDPDDFTSYDGVVGLFSQWTLDRVAEVRETDDRYLHVHVDPSDGSFHGYGPKDDYLLEHGYGLDAGPASVSDRVFHLANRTARRVADAAATDATYADAGVCLYAYNQHSPVPSIPLEDNIVVQVAMGFHADETGMTNDEHIAAWGDKGRADGVEIGVRDYWNYVAYQALNEPSLSLTDQLEEVRGWLEAGLTFGMMETTTSGFAAGRQLYVFSRLAWSPDASEADVAALMDDWYASAFGPAEAPARRIFERWDRGFTLHTLELALTFADLEEAMDLIDAGGATEGERARVEDLVLYAEHLRLLAAFEASEGADRDPAGEDLLRHMWSIHDRRIVQSARIQQIVESLSASRGGMSDAAEARWDVSDASAAGWAEVAPCTSDDVADILAAGLAANPVPADFAEVTFSEDLAPLESARPTGDGTRSATYLVTEQFALYAEAGQAVSFTAEELGSPTLPDRIVVTDPGGEVIADVDIEATTTVDLGALDEGLYVVDLLVFDKARGRVNLTVPDEIAFSSLGAIKVRSDGISRYVKNYFLVPEGTTTLYVHTDSPREPVFYSAGDLTAPVDPARVTRDGALYQVEVDTAGVWAWSDAYLDLTLLNAPNHFAPSPHQLLGPAELLSP